MSAQGFSISKINALETASLDLQMAQRRFLSTRKSRGIVKTNYITTHNRAWKPMAEINLAAVIVFPDAAAKRKLFSLYGGRGKKKKKENV